MSNEKLNGEVKKGGGKNKKKRRKREGEKRKNKRNWKLEMEKSKKKRRKKRKTEKGEGEAWISKVEGKKKNMGWFDAEKKEGYLYEEEERILQGVFFVCAPWAPLTGVSPEHAQIVGSV